MPLCAIEISEWNTKRTRLKYLVLNVEFNFAGHHVRFIQDRAGQPAKP
jgi:hypothetical protein